MVPEPSEVDARISGLERALTTGPASERERALRADLAAALSMRYVRFGGGDGDRVRAERIIAEMLADDAVTAEQRRMLSLLQVSLTMVSASAAAALRDHGPTLDAEALRRTEQWQREVGPAAGQADL